MHDAPSKIGFLRFNYIVTIFIIITVNQFYL